MNNTQQSVSFNEGKSTFNDTLNLMRSVNRLQATLLSFEDSIRVNKELPCELITQ